MENVTLQERKQTGWAFIILYSYCVFRMIMIRAFPFIGNLLEFDVYGISDTCNTIYLVGNVVSCLTFIYLCLHRDLFTNKLGWIAGYTYAFIMFVFGMNEFSYILGKSMFILGSAEYLIVTIVSCILVSLFMFKLIIWTPIKVVVVVSYILDVVYALILLPMDVYSRLNGIYAIIFFVLNALTLILSILWLKGVDKPRAIPLYHPSQD